MANRNIYKEDVDFAVLALQSPAFNKHLKPNGQLDFSDPDAVKQLTKSLLERDFGIKIELPEDRLCPPVPNRFNYILWVQDLLDTTSDSYTEEYDPNREVIGLDIGTGASCIYPLLGCSQRPSWRLAATEIDAKNILYAQRNASENKIKVRIRQTKSNDPLIPLDVLGLDGIDFTICNPPFYASTSDLLSSAAAKSRPPHSACTGSSIEMVTPGGEVAFVSRMIDESVKLKERCQWYTSMLGKYSSVEVIIHNLRGAGVENWAVKDLVQGNKTRRWAVAWSWGSMRPKQVRKDVARGTSTLPKHLLPFPYEYDIHIANLTADSCAKILNKTFQELDIQWQYRSSLATGVGFAKGDIWSRAARRKRHQNPTSIKDETMGQEEDDDDPALGFKIRLTKEKEGSVEVMIRWLKGRDSVLFESFCGMLRRQLTET